MKLFKSSMKLLMIACLSFVATSQALAHRSQANCGGVGVGVQVFKFRLNGTVANTITNGEPIVYTIQVQNDATLPTPSGPVPVCDVTCASIIFHCPDVNGNPGPGFMIATNVNLPFGAPPFIAGSVTCVVSVATGIISARARADVAGVVHDLTIPGCLSNATCVANACDPDTGGGQQEVSVTVRRPCLNVFSQCLSATNFNGSAVRVTFVGSVTNCGNETLVNVSLVNNQPVPGTIVTNISSLAPGTSVSFVGTYTNTSNICGPFSNIMVASGAGIGSLGMVHATNSGHCPRVNAPIHKIEITAVSMKPSGLQLEWTTVLCGQYFVERIADLLAWRVIDPSITVLSTTTHYTDSTACGTVYY